MTTDEARVLDRLERLVSMETPSGDAPRLDALHDVVGGWGAEVLGRRPERVVVEGVPHLLWRATDEPSVLLLGHLDTVFPAGTTERRPFRVDDGRASGPGVFDMKAGVVIALEALERVARPERVALLLTGDEEVGSVTSRSLIEEVARTAAAVLVLEPSLAGALKVGRKGGSFYHLDFHGRAAHAGLEPERGRNALLELARWALELPGLANHDLGTTVTPTVASAGTTVNVVPDRATLTVDVRATTLDEQTRVDEAVRAMVERHRGANGVDVHVDGGINRPPLETSGSEALVALCRGEARRLGLAEPDAVSVGGASDGNFTAALGIPTLDGLGPNGDGAHAEHEWVEVSSIGQRAAIVGGMVDVLTGVRVPEE
ncbi:M20 family metallopeptidase [Nocardioides hwasunensis]|uniref:M20 family metallopeptidase n=1 Tax=Nocardioides hwasunensis TaxID=397258 RepID=A0ABR8MMV4_9ACTN|nr:M20 family metallopeptidase [Nocardioides hwasunensis]MBD3916341.1 M20 family metallopeptidase [Nocardioides hwasunensis]